MNGPGEYYANENKSVRKRQIPYDFTYMCNLINKTNKIERVTDTENRVTPPIGGRGDWRAG